MGDYEWYAWEDVELMDGMVWRCELPWDDDQGRWLTDKKVG